MKTGFYAETEYLFNIRKLTQPGKRLYGETMEELDRKIEDFKKETNRAWTPTICSIFKVTELENKN